MIFLVRSGKAAQYQVGDLSLEQLLNYWLGAKESFAKEDLSPV